MSSTTIHDRPKFFFLNLNRIKGARKGEQTQNIIVEVNSYQQLLNEVSDRLIVHKLEKGKASRGQQLQTASDEISDGPPKLKKYYKQINRIHKDGLSRIDMSQRLNYMKIITVKKQAQTQFYTKGYDKLTRVYHPSVPFLGILGVVVQTLYQ